MALDLENAPFHTTRWTLLSLVKRGSEEESRSALDVICRNYWSPLYVYLRRSGQSEEDAKDLVQSFFLRLIDGDWLTRVEANKGKLRTFLLTLLNRHKASEWRKYYAEKRGGGSNLLSIDEATLGDWFADEKEGVSIETSFDRQWAMTVLDQSFRQLQQEYLDRGLKERFTALRVYLEWQEEEEGRECYEEISKKLSMTEGAVKVAVFRLRKQYREILLSRVKQTLDNGSSGEVEEELVYLMKALGEG